LKVVRTRYKRQTDRQTEMIEEESKAAAQSKVELRALAA